VIGVVEHAPLSSRVVCMNAAAQHSTIAQKVAIWMDMVARDHIRLRRMLHDGITKYGTFHLHVVHGHLHATITHFNARDLGVHGIHTLFDVGKSLIH
jgi:hypothetical protein